VAEGHEAIVARIGDLGEGEMREAKVGDTDVLLANVDGDYFAVAAACTHMGARLADGILRKRRLICPWHHACFDIATGDVQEPPALDALPSYPVTLRGEDVVVTVPDDAPDRQQMPMVGQDSTDARTFAILGGGAAGHAAAEALRQHGFGGRIVLISADPHLPYDRTIMSKDYLNGDGDRSWVPLRPDDFYAQHGIETMVHREVERVEAQDRAIHFVDGEILRYDALLMATGGTPRPLGLPGANLPGVFTLRSYDDADAIIASTGGAKAAVVIGASFIGMEGASALTKRGLKVSVVAPDAVPFESILGGRVGRMLQGVHEEQGVTFHLGKKVARIEGDERVEAVVLESGERIPADLVIVGLGVSPATAILRGIELQEDGSLKVDRRMCASAADALYAAGDIATFPLFPTWEHTRVEHWRTAQQHGRTAALAMLGEGYGYTGVPMFWSLQFAQSIRYVGHTEAFDEIIYSGEPESRTFLAFYIKGGYAVAVAGSNRDRELAVVEEMMRLQWMPSVAALRTGEVDLLAMLARA